MRSRKIRPDLATYNLSLESYLDVANPEYPEKVQQLYMEMKSNDIEPDGATFGLLLNVLAKNERTDKVVELLKDIETRNIVPSESTGKTFAEYFAKKKLPDELGRLSQIMKSHGLELPQVTTKRKKETKKQS
eukprot:TRINITY_DN2470_c0_g1_i2.p2 TRINITY_DN2470_c0_g1~~TRINITY_DN2470_c0_g1_i2.p2  ORF type:complete len:132 (-),score=26.69 TRINITY_DN2470_c0_g1_i2:2-397(-)